jgi:Fur family transcriptional regulator, ferric uptake regulator
VERSEQIDRFKAYLVTQGLKYTRQRQAIAEVFFDSTAHLSLIDLLDLARSRQPSVGYATVYRTMKLLAESGLATEHKFAEGNVRYEPAVAGHHHDHLICVDCGRIVEYEDEEIERLQEELAHRHGFRVVAHRHEIYASCQVANCPERKRPQETVAGALKLSGVRPGSPTAEWAESDDTD